MAGAEQRHARAAGGLSERRHRALGDKAGPTRPRVFLERDRWRTVTAADVQRVAAKYLVKTGRTVVVTAPKAAAAVKGGL